MPLTPGQRDEIETIFTGVVRNAFSRLQNLTLSAHAINPFLAVLVARRPRDLAEFIVNQRVERGLVTSFGMQIQRIVRVVGANLHSSGVEGADLERVDPALRRHFLAQVKSGPETINSDIANQIRRNLNSAENRIRMGGLPAEWSVVKMLGMIYGTARHRNTWVMGLGAQGFDVARIGREFWEFASLQPGTHQEIFDIASRVAYSARDDSGRTLPEAIQDRVASLTNELRAHYSNAQGDIEWSRLVEENM
jgi:hypothetical protein